MRIGGGKQQNFDDEDYDIQESTKNVDPALPSITGVVTHIIYASLGYTIYGIEADNKRLSMTVKGANNRPFEKGDSFKAHGAWGEYKGQRQFQAILATPYTVGDDKGVRKWLEKEEIEGIKSGLKKKILAYPVDVILKWFDGNASVLDKIVPEEITHRIRDKWKENRDLNELYVKLSNMGMNATQISRVTEEMETPAILAALKNNIWVFIEIDGIGFKTLDKYHLEQGRAYDDPARVSAGIRYTMKTLAKNTGSTCFDESNVIENAVKTLNLQYEDVTKTIADMIHKKSLIISPLNGKLYTKGMYDSEDKTARRVAQLLLQPKKMSDEEAEHLINLVAKSLGFKLDVSQYAAAKMALTEPICIITGGPGTGKSTIQRVITMALDEQNKKFLLAAPTGKAAKRLGETTKCASDTLHKTLAFNPKKKRFAFNSVNQLLAEHLVVDEFSIAGMYISGAMFEALNPGLTALTPVGDVNQLASVDAGDVLNDLISSGVIPVSRLNTTHRQDGTTSIIEVAAAVNRGDDPLRTIPNLKGFEFEQRGERLIDRCLHFMRNEAIYLGLDPNQDIQFMSSMYDGEDGIDHANRALKMLLNPPLNDGRSIKMLGTWYTIGDRVMHINTNTERVKNGECGKIVAIHRGMAVEGGKMVDKLEIDYGGTTELYDANMMKNITFAWCFSIHKSQGSEFLNTVLLTPKKHGFFLEKSLIYTAITRTKDSCKVIGDYQTFLNAIRKNNRARRVTGLQQAIRHHYELMISKGYQVVQEPVSVSNEPVVFRGMR